MIFPQMDGDKIDISIKANEEHIIILRRFSSNCRYNTQYLTHRRRYTEAEMMQMAKETKQKQELPDLDAYFKLYNSNHGTVFYFCNEET